MTEALADHEDRMSDIENYTVSQTFMGSVTTMYFVRQDVEGRSVFLPDPAHTTIDGENLMEGMDAQDMSGAFDSNYYLQPDIMERARIDGSADVDGEACWIIVLDDFEGLDLELGGQARANVTPTLMRMHMDKDEYVARMVQFDGTMTQGTVTTAISTSSLMTDYREVDGMLYPFRVEISSDLGGGQGAGDDAAPSGGQQAAIQAMMDQMGDDLSDAERAMVEVILQNEGEGGLQDMLNQAMSSMVVETTELLVNAGPPPAGSG